MDIGTLAGYAGIVTGISFMIPQVYKSYQTKSVGDLSWGTLILFLFNCIFWLTYGIFENAQPVVIVNSIAFVVTLTQIVLKVKYST